MSEAERVVRHMCTHRCHLEFNATRYAVTLQGSHEGFSVGRNVACPVVRDWVVFRQRDYMLCRVQRLVRAPIH